MRSIDEMTRRIQEKAELLEKQDRRQKRLRRTIVESFCIASVLIIGSGGIIYETVLKKGTVPVITDLEAGNGDVIINSLEELENDSELIVLGVMGAESDDNDDLISSKYRISDFIITEVFNGRSYLSDADNNIIKICEAETSADSKSMSLLKKSYQPMVDDQEYLLFLRRSEYGNDHYEPVGYMFGTVSLNEDGRLEQYRKWFEECSRFEELFVVDDVETIWNTAKEKYIEKNVGVENRQ